MQPLVSIIMPAFNAAPYIAEAVRSVINQSYTKWELIVINDGSDDNTDEICSAFQESRIQYLEQFNQGVSVARNKGLDFARGEYICFLDADDVLPLNSIEVRMNKFLQDPSLMFVDGVVSVLDETLTKELRTYKPSFRGNPLLELFRLRDSCFFGPSWLIKYKKPFRLREDLSHGEDLFFFMNLARAGGIYDYVEDEVLLYRRHANAAMFKLDKLHQGYKKIYALLATWPEFSLRYRYIYQWKVRRMMCLSYLRAGLPYKALRALII